MNDHKHGAGKKRLAPKPEAAAGQPADRGRDEYLDRLKTQIRSGVYQPDVRDLARSLASMIVREL